MPIGDPKLNRKKTKRTTATAVNIAKTRFGPDRALFAEGGPTMAKANPFAKKAAGAMPGDGTPKKLPPWLMKGKAAEPPAKGKKAPAFAAGGMTRRGMGAARKGC